MQRAEILELAGLRVDGRKPNEMRPLQHKIGLLPHADGSCYLEQGLNKVLVLVQGPHEPSKKLDNANEKCNIVCRIEYAPFSGSERKQRKQGDRRVVEQEKVIADSLESVILTELYPRSEITVVVHYLETDGSVLCTAINATMLALMNAGISMSDMLSACTVGTVRDKLCLDLTQVESSAGGAVMPVVIKCRSEEIVFLQLDARLSLDMLEDALKKTIGGCVYIKNYLETAIRSFMSTHVQNNKK